MAIIDVTKPTLSIERVFDAPRVLLYRLWTDPLHAVRWFGPVAFPARELKMDVRPGGRWRGCLVSVEDGRELWLGGVYREVRPSEKLAFTFAWEEEGERGIETLVSLRFDEAGSRTLMRLDQSPFQSVAERDGHNGGWNSAFDRLAQLLVDISAKA